MKQIFLFCEDGEERELVAEMISRRQWPFDIPRVVDFERLTIDGIVVEKPTFERELNRLLSPTDHS